MQFQLSLGFSSCNVNVLHSDSGRSRMCLAYTAGKSGLPGPDSCGCYADTNIWYRESTAGLEGSRTTNLEDTVSTILLFGKDFESFFLIARSYHTIRYLQHRDLSTYVKKRGANTANSPCHIQKGKVCLSEVSKYYIVLKALLQHLFHSLKQETAVMFSP